MQVLGNEKYTQTRRVYDTHRAYKTQLNLAEVILATVILRYHCS